MFRSFNHGVRGSNPRGLANKNKELKAISNLLASKKMPFGSDLEAGVPGNYCFGTHTACMRPNPGDCIP
jgi:hypothetical protein